MLGIYGYFLSSYTKQSKSVSSFVFVFLVAFKNLLLLLTFLKYQQIHFPTKKDTEVDEKKVT